jgi:hypothetical protein
VHFRFVAVHRGAHYHIDVFIGRAGRDSTHGKSGTLVMREDEFREWRQALAWSVNRGETEILWGGE